MKIENKFIVINMKHLEPLSNDEEFKPIYDKFIGILKIIEVILPDNRYWVVNQDESYANEIFKLIEKGEDSK